MAYFPKLQILKTNTTSNAYLSHRNTLGSFPIYHLDFYMLLLNGSWKNDINAFHIKFISQIKWK